MPTNPDNINGDNTEFILEILEKGRGYEYFIEKQEKEKSEKRQLEDENRNLKKENEVLSQRMKKIKKENTIKKLKQKITRYKAMQYGSISICAIIAIIAIICYFTTLKEWLEKISLLLSIFGIGGSGLIGGIVWLYKYFQKKIEIMKNKIKEINNV